ncbi:hypothetical protein [Oerskovia flava]|uniref:hypothetical protein n=1 Tax=Oerskovia flava TaxID=2986422 RepID=UPI00224068EB|nr:hypothetical protein [Oerskovia sp. JB1-3-2]
MRVEYTSAVPDDVPERLATEVDDAVEPRTFAPLDAAAARELAERYLEHFLKFTGTRAERLEDDAEIEVWDEVGDRAREEPDPLPLLDALVTLGYERVPLDDHAFLAFVAAGAVEDAVVERTDLREAIAERSRTGPAWRLAVQDVWVDADLAVTLPAPLDELVTMLGTPDGTPGGAGRRERRRASKRQGRRGRHR